MTPDRNEEHGELDAANGAVDGQEQGASAVGQEQQQDVQPSPSSPSEWVPFSSSAAADSQKVPLQPPADCVNVTPDGGVLKKVLQAGEGDSPTLHARCLVHYTCRLCSSGELIMDTRNESQSQQPVRVVAGRDASAKETGLTLAVATMRQGEVASVYVVDPQYGFGQQGNFSFPAVPPNAQLVYVVELVDWEEVEESEDRGGLLFEERLEVAERRRLLGNALFKEGKVKEALGKYAVALSYLDEDLMMQLEGVYLDKAQAVKNNIHLNMAACQLRTEDYHTAIYNCTEVLNLDPSNVKALFRRGRARHALGQSDEALTDLQAAYQRDPSDKAILKELHAVKETLKQERAAQAKLFKGAFKFPDPAPGQQSAAAATASGSGDATAATAQGSWQQPQAGQGQQGEVVFNGLGHRSVVLLTWLGALWIGLWRWLWGRVARG